MVFSIEEDKNVENIKDEQVVEFVDEIVEEITSLIYRLYDKTLRDLVKR
ncbi:hypothetical protein ACQKMI_11705 [Lysinibacillus sp. NPDC097214]